MNYSYRVYSLSSVIYIRLEVSNKLNSGEYQYIGVNRNY
jgi:hypothetical protein